MSTETLGLFGSARRQFSLRRLLFVVFPALAVLLLIGKGVAHYTGLIKPPRPTYCNVYGYHHRGQWSPSWGPSYYMYDKLHRVGWADFDDNAILVVDTADTQDVTRFGTVTYLFVHPGLNATEVEFGVPDRTTTVRRKRDTLVVVRRDGRAREFRIEDGIAKRFYDKNVFHDNTVCPSLLDAARSLLAHGDREHFDAFLRD